MATWIIGLIIVGCVYLASKQVIKAHKTGGCIGCDAGAELSSQTLQKRMEEQT